jgi:hypothetical protein
MLILVLLLALACWAYTTALGRGCEKDLIETIENKVEGGSAGALMAEEQRTAAADARQSLQSACEAFQPRKYPACTEASWVGVYTGIRVGMNSGVDESRRLAASSAGCHDHLKKLCPGDAASKGPDCDRCIKGYRKQFLGNGEGKCSDAELEAFCHDLSGAEELAVKGPGGVRGKRKNAQDSDQTEGSGCNKWSRQWFIELGQVAGDCYNKDGKLHVSEIGANKAEKKKANKR